MKESQTKRQDRADLRQAQHDLLSPEEKIAKLDKKFGKDQGAARERSRLASQISARDVEEALSLA